LIKNTPLDETEVEKITDNYERIFSSPEVKGLIRIYDKVEEACKL